MKYKNIITRKRESFKGKLNKFLSRLLFKYANIIKTKNIKSVFYGFQRIRDYRMLSLDNRIPTNDSLWLKKTAIFELFPIEQIDEIKNGFKKLLKVAHLKNNTPKILNNYERIEKSINSLSQNFSGRSYHNFNIVIDLSEMKNSLIEFATFQIIRPLDTFIILNIIVTPSVKFLNEFEKIISTQFQGEQVLSVFQLIKSGLKSYSSTMRIPTEIMNEKLEDLLCELKHKARDYFSKYFKGLLFLKDVFPPSIDFFLFNKHQQVSKEITRKNLFWASFETNNTTSLNYSTEEKNSVLKIIENINPNIIFTNYVILIKNDSLFPSNFNSFNDFISFNINQQISFFSSIIIYNHYISYIKSILTEFRKILYKTNKTYSTRIEILQKQLTLLSKYELYFKRIKNELDIDDIDFALQESGIGEFKVGSKNISIQIKAYILNNLKNISENISYFRELLKEQNSFNIEKTNYKIQRKLFWLTIIAIIIGIISVYDKIPSIIDCIKKLVFNQ